MSKGKRDLFIVIILLVGLLLLFCLPLFSGCASLDYRHQTFDPDARFVTDDIHLHVYSFGTDSVLNDAQFKSTDGTAIKIGELVRSIDPNTVAAMETNIGDLIDLLKDVIPLLVAAQSEDQHITQMKEIE